MDAIQTDNASLINDEDRWEENYQKLLLAKNGRTLMEIINQASESEWEYFYNKARNTLFVNTKESKGIFQKIGDVLLPFFGGVGGGTAVATFGTSTTSVGFMGVTLTLTTATAPLTFIGVGAIGGAAAVYGVYKLATNSAELTGKREHYKEMDKEARYDINPERILNPFIFLYPREMQQVCKFFFAIQSNSKENQEMIDFRFKRLFDSRMLNAAEIENRRKDPNNENAIKQLSQDTESLLKQEIGHFQNQYKLTAKEYINRCVALMDINNEFVTPRILQGEQRVKMQQIQEGVEPISNAHLIYEQFIVLFNMYKVLLEHPQNTPEQQAIQKTRMQERAKQLWEEKGEEQLDAILKQEHPIKLNKNNYIDYLKEIVSVFDKETGKIFIQILLQDLAQCMLVDGKLEAYEQEMLQDLLVQFAHLHSTDINALLAQGK